MAIDPIAFARGLREVAYVAHLGKISPGPSDHEVGVRTESSAPRSGAICG